MSDTPTPTPFRPFDHVTNPSPLGPLQFLENTLARQLSLLASDDSLRPTLQSAHDDVQARLAALRSAAPQDS